MQARNALFQLGMDLNGGSRSAQTEVSPAINEVVKNDNARKDHCIERDGVRYAGIHLLIDLRGAQRTDDLDHVEATLRACVEAAGATLLDIGLHHFTPNNGVSGVAMLAESHISIHTWPEHHYAAVDVFMCGSCRPHEAVEVLRRAFSATHVSVSEHLRGRDV